MDVLILKESTRQSVTMSKDTALRLIEIGETFISEHEDEDELGDVVDEPSLARKRSVIECFRDPHSDEKWIISVRNHIGAIEANGQLIVIEPKIPLSHFTQISKFGFARFKMNNDRVSLEADSSFENLIASWFVKLCSQIVPKDLRSSYEPKLETLSLIRGRPKLVRSSVMWMSGNLATECEFEEFDVDNPLNRLLKWGLNHVARIPTVHTDVRANASGLSNLLQDVSDAKDFDFFASVTRETLHYGEAIELVHLLRRGEGRSLNNGNSQTTAFLLYTPSLIENGIRAMIEKSVMNFIVEKKSKKLKLGSANPDLIFRNVNSINVGDVKYVVNNSGWRTLRSAAQQSVFFAAAFKTYKSVVVAFSDESQAIETELVGNHAIALIRWNIDINESPLNSQQTFLKQVEEWLLVDTNSPRAVT